MQDDDRMFDGKGVAHRRCDAFYVPLHTGSNTDRHRSLRAWNEAVAIKAARRWNRLEFRARHGIPIEADPSGEFVASAHDMRQIGRAAQVWHCRFIQGVV